MSPAPPTRQCARCDRTRTRMARTFPDGTVCPPCYRATFRRVGDCVACGRRRVLPGQRPDGGLCAPCTGIGGYACTTCGADDAVLHRLDECEHCELRRRLTEVFGTTTSPTGGDIIEVLCAVRHPRSVHALMRRSPQAVALLIDIAEGRRTLTHDTLDEVDPPASVRHLRDLLVDGGLLPARDRQLAAFDRWATTMLAEITPAADRRIITSYATWHHRRRLARHVEDGALKPWATRVARQQIRVATVLLAWLRARGTTLDRCTQDNLDRWFAAGPTTRRQSVHFLHWATDHQHCQGLRIPTLQVPLPAPMPHPDRVALVGRLLTDDGLALADRVAGLFVVVCAQPATRISVLRIDAVEVHGATTSVMFGSEQVPLAEPVALLVHQLAAEVLARSPGTPWLFRGRVPGHPMGASALSQRLRAIGVTGAARVAALHDLIGQIPTPILADALGYNPNFVAERAANLSTGWNAYAALPRTSSATGVGKRRIDRH